MSGTTKRRSSEKRKEKSRDAARTRRSQEAEIFSQLCGALPVPSSVQSQLDKTSVMRIAISHLKLSKIIQPCSDEDEKKDNLWMRALDGFLILLSQDVDIIFVSESIANYLGISQIDLIGQSLLDFLHPCDHDEIIDYLNHKTSNKNKVFFLRMKCTLTSKGRNSNLKSASYKVIKLCGEFQNLDIKNSNPANKENGGQQYYVAIGETIPHPADIDIKLDSKTFLSKHNMDMTFTYCDERINELIGFDHNKLVGESIYNYHHVMDAENLEKAYKNLFSKGQVMTDRYRFLARNGGYVWVVTQATIIYTNRTHRPESVVCVHYVLSDIEERKLVLADFQKTGSESMLQFFKPSTEDVFRPKSELQDEDMYMAPGLTKSMMSDTNIDLTYLAPMAGDACIPLPLPEPYNDKFKKEKDSFHACRGRDQFGSTGTTPISSPPMPNPPTPEDYVAPFDPNDTDIMSTFFSEVLPTSKSDDSFEENDLNMRAPYIPMTPENDFRLFPPTSDDLLGINKDFNPWFFGRTESVFLPKEKIFPEQPKESAPSLRDLLEAQNVVSCIERPQDKNMQQMKRPLDKSSLEKGPPAKVMRTQAGPQSGMRAKSSFDSVLMNLLLTGEDKQNGYTTKDLKMEHVVPKERTAPPRAAHDISNSPNIHHWTIPQGTDLWKTLKLMTPDISM